MTTILQITDPHLLSRPDATLKGVPTSASLAMVLARARQEVADPARIVLTGDLSHEETVAGYQLLKDQLGDLADRTLLIPGNHDLRAGMREVFQQVPGAPDEHVWFRCELGPWLLLGLDSHVPGEVYGQLGQPSLDQLSGWLAEDESRPVLIFLHHHPVDVGSAWVDTIGLRNARSLETLLARHPRVRGVFFGHIHQVFEGQLAGVPCYSAPSAAIQFSPGRQTMQFDLKPPGFRLIELHDGQFSTRVVRLDELPFTPRED